MAVGGAEIYGYGEVPDMLLTHSAMSPSYSCPPFGLAMGREGPTAFNTRDNKVGVSRLCDYNRNRHWFVVGCGLPGKAALCSVIGDSGSIIQHSGRPK